MNHYMPIYLFNNKCPKLKQHLFTEYIYSTFMPSSIKATSKSHSVLQFELLSPHFKFMWNPSKTLFQVTFKWEPVRRRCRRGSQSETGSGCPGWLLSASSRCSGCGGPPTTRWSYHWWTHSLDTWKGQETVKIKKVIMV